jgi:hypothetical protein
MPTAVPRLVLVLQRLSGFRLRLKRVPVDTKFLKLPCDRANVDFHTILEKSVPWKTVRRCNEYTATARDYSWTKVTWMCPRRCRVEP